MANTLKNLFRHGNVLKILCLAFGITAGLLLVAKVHFEKSFDTFFPGNEHVYVIRSLFERENESMSYDQTSGAIAPYMAAEIPDIVCGTRMTYLWDSNTKYAVDEENMISMNFMLADSMWFEVFASEVLAGNPREVLAKPFGTMVSRSVAEKFGGVDQAVGKTFHPDMYPDLKFEIGGVFEDYPENSTLNFTAISSLAAYNQQSTENWVGNDRYRSYAKLRPGADIEAVTAAMRRVQESHVNINEIEEAGIDLRYGLGHISELHRENPKVRNLNNMMLLIAAILIVIAVLNYILIVLSTLMERAKEIGVRKCYGSSSADLLRLVAAESLVNLLAALAVGAALAAALRGIIEKMLGVSYAALFTPATIAVLAAIVAAVLAVTVAATWWFFARVPVAAAFRGLSSSRRWWKKCLLFVEFAGSAYVAVMLINISRQYTYMTAHDTGYDIENLLVCDGGKIESERLNTLVASLKGLTAVENAALGCSLPIDNQSGNNVQVPGDPRELFNVCDLYYVSDGYFPTLGITLAEGKVFDPAESNENKIMVSRRFAEKMHDMLGWDSAIGRSVRITEHSRSESDLFTISGVFSDIEVGSVASADTRPQVIFYNHPNNNLYRPTALFIRLREMTPENIAEVNKTIAAVAPGSDLMAESYRLLVNQYYESERNLRNSVTACCIIALAISLIGLIGYVGDEVNRRRKEIAVRKVNGATVADILRLLSSGITRIAVPALLAGGAAALWTTLRWFDNYSTHAPLSIPAALAGVAAVYIVVLLCAGIRSYRAATANPVASLCRNE